MMGSFMSADESMEEKLKHSLEEGGENHGRVGLPVEEQSDYRCKVTTLGL